MKKINEGMISKYLGNSAVVLRSQTTRLASTFQALMPPSAVPMSNCKNKCKTDKSLT